MKIRVKLAVSKKFRVLYTSLKRFFVFYGGRGSGKTYEVAQFLVQKILEDTNVDQRYLCLRENQVDLMSSTKATIWKTIKRMGVENMFHTAPSSSFITCLHNSCRFEFKGCRNLQEADKLRSVENVPYVWIEECHNLKQEVYEVLEPSFRDETGSVFILTFNPMRKQDYVYQEFVLGKPEHVECVNVNYFDNPFFWNNLSLVDSMTRSKGSPFAFRRIWLGEPGFVENQLIKPEWWRFYNTLGEALKICTGMYITADTAYKTGNLHDYTVIQLWGYNSGAQLMLLKQIRGKWEFPTLVSKMISFTAMAHKLCAHVNPSRIYIEDKASGISLVQTLAREGMNVIAWKPKDFHFPDDKVGRANEAALMISCGIVYIPLPANESWVDDYITEHSEFSEDSDAGFDDQVDATTMGISVFRSKGGGAMLLRTA